MRLKFLLAFALSLFSSVAFSGYQSLVVIGDSLSDMGNGAFITGGVAPGTPTGRPSNGPVAAEYLAARLGIQDFKASSLGGTNHAVFGATTGTQNFSFVANTPPGSSSFPALATTGMQNQLGAVAAGGPFNADNTLFMVWGGANDIFLADLLGQDLSSAAGVAVGNLMGIVGGLLGLGAENILVVGMPELGLTPLASERGPEAQAGLTALSVGFNDALSGLVAQTRQLTGTNLMFFDPAEVTQVVAADPAASGFTNITEQCIKSPVALATNCAGYAFLDEVHPTTAIHALFGKAMAVKVSEPSSPWILLLATLGWMQLRIRRANQARGA